MKRELSPEESQQYIKVVQKGNKDDMFDFAYALGAKHQAEHIRDEMIKFGKEQGLSA